MQVIPPAQSVLVLHGVPNSTVVSQPERQAKNSAAPTTRTYVSERAKESGMVGSGGRLL